MNNNRELELKEIDKMLSDIEGRLSILRDDQDSETISSAHRDVSSARYSIELIISD